MGSFVAKKSKTFKRKVPVMSGDEHLGDLSIEVEKISTSVYNDLVAQQEDDVLVRRILKSVDDIPQEGTDQNYTGEEALKFVLEDISCVAAIAADYIETFKTKNFRKAGSKRRS